MWAYGCFSFLSLFLQTLVYILMHKITFDHLHKVQHKLMIEQDMFLQRNLHLLSIGQVFIS